jgi:hypothetical protein
MRSGSSRSGVVSVLVCALIVVAGTRPTLGQRPPTSAPGGGYVGSDQWFKSQTDSATQRGTLERNLGGRDAAGGTGREVDLRIVFPAAQKGLGNIMQVLLVPEGGGAPEVSGLASFDKAGHAITTGFAPRKQVRAGHTYAVVLVDARSGTYGPVGRITVGPAARQAFKIEAPMLGPSQSASPPPPRTDSSYTPPKTGAYEPPRAGEGFERPATGPGYVRPKVGEGYVAPGSR